MIKCNLSRIMGEKRLKISEVARATGINRGTITRLYHETAERIGLQSIESLCRYLDCELSDLFELVDQRGDAQARRESGNRVRT